MVLKCFRTLHQKKPRRLTCTDSVPIITLRQLTARHEFLLPSYSVFISTRAFRPDNYDPLPNYFFPFLVPNFSPR